MIYECDFATGFGFEEYADTPAKVYRDYNQAIAFSFDSYDF